MLDSKYSRDYLLEEQIDPLTGRISTSAVYRGKYYIFTPGKAGLKKARRLFPILTAVILITWLGALSLNVPCAHVWYCNVPFVAMVFPLWFAAASGGRLLCCREPLTRQWRDKTCRRYLISLLFLLIFSIFALAGSISYMLLYSILRKEEFFPGNLVYPAAAAVIAASSAWLLFRRSLLDTVELQPA